MTNYDRKPDHWQGHICFWLALICTLIAYDNFTDSNPFDWAIGLGYIGASFFFASMWMHAIIGTSIIFTKFARHFGVTMMGVALIKFIVDVFF